MTFINWYRDLAIKHKLLLIFVVQALVPLLLLSTLIIYRSNDVMSNYAQKMSTDVLKTIERQVNDFLVGVEVVSKDLLFDQQIYDVLNGSQIVSIDNLDRVNQLKNTLRKRTLAYDSIQSISLVDKNGHFYTYDRNSGRANIEDLMPLDAMLVEAEAAKGASVWFVDANKSEQHIYLVRIINDRDNYKPIGLMAILVDMDHLKKLYEAMSSDLLQHIAILTPEDTLVFNSQPQDDQWIGNVLMSSSEQGVFTTGGSEYIGTYRILSQNDWRLVIGFSKRAITGDFTRLVQYLLLAMVPIILAMAMLTMLASKDLTTAMDKVVMAMRAFKRGEKETQLSSTRKDEIGFLSETFDAMSHEIDYLMNNIYQEQLIRKEVQLKALQAQINPHFLFNTLETINWYAQMVNAEAISEMVTALSALMDATISRTSHFIDFDDEVTYVKHYVVIMSHRFGDRLTVKFDVDPLANLRQVPQLMLQPLVENAILHGLSSRISGGKILVRARLVDTHLHIDVVDNGIGIDQVKLLQLNEHLQAKEEDRTKTKSSERIGLANVAQRLRLIYGDAIKVQVTSQPNCYTKVSLVIPKVDTVHSTAMKGGRKGYV